ncbi:hypothetical protein [Alicyclobacillus acidoterrestris]|uniref:Uncharacterized protein n=1 Tax=Alicyclobacillus acidoterrestris (strain ATCC 49025 / DSM 3922 / CIP 106132 / NCIMB 13137 / GD3B) TaxID=1356854 RepID=T0BW46_ALIAG|nr:hypothetical protein [Alicyclobacillus acidoterrestris]EPZ44620.1 hypothetical protein N007_10295 [Alicyclobacillus acidoterrestris ATCC 49025]UNO50362.1 hypothetical protein K1I37_07780 [Alicyclobacillus acidoterrestris]
MRSFDQLDWVHRFEDYEMIMYLQQEGTEDDGIYMQVLQRNVDDGAEEWNILYDRRLTSEIGKTSVSKEDPAYEDEILRVYLHEHPTLVDDEKTYLRAWLASSGAKKDGENL